MWLQYVPDALSGPSGWMGQRPAWFHLCSHPPNTLVSKMWAQHGINTVHWSGSFLPSPSHNSLTRKNLSKRHLPCVITSSIPKWHLSCPLSWNHNDWWSRVRKSSLLIRENPTYYLYSTSFKLSNKHHSIKSLVIVKAKRKHVHSSQCHWIYVIKHYNGTGMI